eukprot:scaffold1505_cov390-Prasinococcus_capsulatus_cf.AAC.15
MLILPVQRIGIGQGAAAKAWCAHGPGGHPSFDICVAMVHYGLCPLLSVSRRGAHLGHSFPGE